MKILTLMIVSALLMLIDASAQSSTHCVLSIAARSNGISYSGPSQEYVDEAIERSLGYGLGLCVLHKFNPTSAIKYGIAINQRGFSGSDSKIDYSTTDASVDYLDFPIIFQHYFLVDKGEKNVHPIIFFGTQFGFPMSSDDSFNSPTPNIVLLFGAGVSIPLSRFVAIEVGLGYDHGLVYFSPFYSGQARFNSFVISTSFSFTM